MSKNTIKGFFCNKVFFVFVGLFVLVAVAYLFANDNLGGQSKQFKGFVCTPHNTKCTDGMRIFVTGVGLNQKVGDGCKKLPNGDCSGTCYWCEASDDRGRYCEEVIEYSGYCVVDIPNTPMSCGPSRAHNCRRNGKHGISGCCPDEDKNIEPEGNCDNIATCVSIDE